MADWPIAEGDGHDYSWPKHYGTGNDGGDPSGASGGTVKLEFGDTGYEVSGGDKNGAGGDGPTQPDRNPPDGYAGRNNEFGS